MNLNNGLNMENIFCIDIIIDPLHILLVSVFNASKLKIFADRN